MAKLSLIRSDTAKEREGVWQTYPGTDIKCKIARLGNPEYEQAATRMRKAVRVQLSMDGELPEHEAKKAIAPAIADHILLDWKNVEDDNGTPISYSRENVLKVLGDPELHDFFDWVMQCGRNGEVFRKTTLDDTVGNSLPA